MIDRLKIKVIFDVFARGGIRSYYKSYYESRDKLKSFSFKYYFFDNIIIYDSFHILFFPTRLILNKIELHLHGNELIWLKLNNRNGYFFRFRALLLNYCLILLAKRGKVYSVSDVVPAFYKKYFKFDFLYKKLIVNISESSSFSDGVLKKLLLVGGNEKVKNIKWFDDNCALQLLYLDYEITYVGYRSKYSQVESLNYCSHSSLLRLMELNDALIITSRSEGVPILIYEALELGLKIFHRKNSLLDLDKYSMPFDNYEDLIQKL